MRDDVDACGASLEGRTAKAFSPTCGTSSGRSAALPIGWLSRVGMPSAFQVSTSASAGLRSAPRHGSGVGVMRSRSVPRGTVG